MKDIGFKAGLEIHQQLAGKKLFCRCPAINSDKAPDTKAVRKLRAVIGETGEIDVAAAHEMQKGKTFLYQSNSEDTCLVEYDEEPPLQPLPEHIEIAIMVSKLLNAKIVDEIQVMRKIVVDGSNVSGFQRTMLIGYDGFIETEKGKVGIPTILLEEEAAQRVKEEKDTITFSLDRLGIALLEISTDASLKDAEHVKEVAAHIGMVLRSTGKVKRGLGTIRQDVNVSIKGGERTEIKGFQDLRSIPKVIAGEIARQQQLIKEKKGVEKAVRKANADFTTSFLRPMPGAARLYPETDIIPIPLDKKFVESIRLPELMSDKLASLQKKLNLPEHTIKEIIQQELPIEALMKSHKLDAKTIAQVCIDIPKDIKTRLGIDTDKLELKEKEEVLAQLAKGTISKDALTDILALKAQGKKVDYKKFAKTESKDIEAGIAQIIKEKPGLSPGAYMGLVMQHFKGKVDGKEAMSILQKLLK